MRIVWIAAGLVAGIIIGVLVGWAKWGFASASPPVPTVDSPAILHEIQRLSDLVTVKYTVQKVVGLEEKKQPVGSEKLLLFVQADVLAGIDLSKMKPSDVQILADHHIRIGLPAPRIMNIVIDDQQTKVWDRQITWWTPWVPYDRDLERQARLKARAAIEQGSIEGGILSQARQNAEIAIRGLLESLGWKVTIDEHPTSVGMFRQPWLAMKSASESGWVKTRSLADARGSANPGLQEALRSEPRP